MKRKKEKKLSPPHQQTFHFVSAMRAFLGYLKATQKSNHTIKNYQLDLLSFENFLNQSRSSLAQLNRIDLSHYHTDLKIKGLKINTRRRKLLTVSQFLQFLSKRKKLFSQVAQKFPLPHKIERVPFVVCTRQLIQTIKNLPSSLVLEKRNQALLWTLSETGCLVSEIGKICFKDWQEAYYVKLGIQTKRKVPVSKALYQLIQDLKKNPDLQEKVFLGYNKFGPLGVPISPRGVELLVKAYRPKLGYENLVPRTFRHSVVLQWHHEGIDLKEIQKRLGLKTAYAFRVYQALFQAHDRVFDQSPEG